MSLKNNYKATICAACLGYVTQAIMLNFPPLLFIFFQEKLGLTLFQISFLISANFITELIVDVLVSKYSSKIGQRFLIILGNSLAVLGLCTMFILPDLIPNSFVALMISMILCGAGGGIMEVLISPVVEACPTKNKAGTMSILHSFYCWGQVAVVLLSTIFFLAFGIDNWLIAAMFWTLVPIACIFMFSKVTIYDLVEDGQESSPMEILKSGIFWVLVVMMLCAGASELAMSQWASAFCESALGVEKWLGDLLGPCLFAVCMGATRVLYGKFADKLDLTLGIFISTVVCIIAYLITIVSPFPALSLIGCGLCGIGAGILWPASFSIASAKMPRGGVFLFGMLALAGDGGCLVGPFLAGQVSSAFGDNLKAGFVIALVFPVILCVISLLMFLKNKRLEKQAKGK
ncbi:MAG: MFS transporter [Clostridia bacterium]|nr:MFS transporter [Clostridia bacterium]